MGGLCGASQTALRLCDSHRPRLSLLSRDCYRGNTLTGKDHPSIAISVFTVSAERLMNVWQTAQRAPWRGAWTQRQNEERVITNQWGWLEGEKRGGLERGVNEIMWSWGGGGDNNISLKCYLHLWIYPISPWATYHPENCRSRSERRRVQRRRRTHTARRRSASADTQQHTQIERGHWVRL